jgi:hypothetical protein
MLNDPFDPGWARKHHADPQQLVDELKNVMRIIHEEYDNTRFSHVPVVVSIAADELATQQGVHVLQKLHEGDLNAVTNSTAIFMVIAMRFGYRLARDGIKLEPCYCDTSAEVRRHVSRILEELLEEGD